MKKALIIIINILAWLSVASCSATIEEPFTEPNITIEDVIGHWTAQSILINHNWIDLTDNESLHLDATFYPDMAYRGSGFLGEGEGTWDLDNNVLNTYIDGTLYLTYQIKSLNGNIALVAMSDQLTSYDLILSKTQISIPDIPSDPEQEESESPQPLEGVCTRRVLMEMFTGQICVNCPAAHEVIADLLKQYPENLISVSIHGGGDAFSYSEEKLPGYGLRNNEGQAYCDEYKIASLPAAVVNRNSGVLTTDQWASSIRNEMAKPSHMDLNLVAAKSADGKTINISTEVIPYENLDANLQLWVVESGIKSLQLTPEGLKVDYVHNHVFRGTVNGHNGEKVKLSPQETKNFNHQIEVRDIWNGDNLSIVAFVYTDNGVEQAAETEVK